MADPREAEPWKNWVLFQRTVLYYFFHVSLLHLIAALQSAEDRNWGGTSQVACRQSRLMHWTCKKQRNWLTSAGLKVWRCEALSMLMLFLRLATCSSHCVFFVASNRSVMFYSLRLVVPKQKELDMDLSTIRHWRDNWSHLLILRWRFVFHLTSLTKGNIFLRGNDTHCKLSCDRNVFSALICRPNKMCLHAFSQFSLNDSVLATPKKLHMSPWCLSQHKFQNDKFDIWNIPNCASLHHPRF